MGVTYFSFEFSTHPLDFVWADEEVSVVQVHDDEAHSFV